MKFRRIVGSLLAVVLAAASINVGFAQENEALTYDESVEIGNDVVNLSASSGTFGGNLTWTLDDGVLTIGGTGDMADYDWMSSPWADTSIEAVVIEEGVTSIGDYVFLLCTSLTSITIPDSVTRIGGCAFYDCTSLTSITIPDSVTSIGDNAFYDCISLTSIAIPDSVTSIGESAFYNCRSLTSITIPEISTMKLIKKDDYS